MKYLLSILLLLLLLLTANAWGATAYTKTIGGTVYYDTTASSCDDVTAADTASDLEGASEAVGNNGTVNICTGTYSTTELDSDSQFRISNSSQTINVVETVVIDHNNAGFGVYFDINSDGSTLNSNGYLTINNIGDGGTGIFIQDASNITINDAIIVGNSADSSVGIQIRGEDADDVTLSGNNISAVYIGIQTQPEDVTTPAGGTCTPPSNITITGNTIHTINGTPYASADGIAFHNDDVLCDYDGTVISYNNVSGFADEGIDVIGTTNILIDSNVIHDSVDLGEGNGSGMKLANNDAENPTVTVRNNLIYNLNAGNTCNGITGNDWGGLFAHNTISNVDGAGFSSGNGAANSQTIVNNIFAFNNLAGGPNGSCLGLITPDILEVDYNDYWECGDNIGRVDGANYTTWATYVAAISGVGGDEANSPGVVDPKFVNASGSTFRDFMPKNKLVYNGGTDVSLTTDGLGYKIVGTPPIGAVEFALIRTLLGD